MSAGRYSQGVPTYESLYILNWWYFENERALPVENARVMGGSGRAGHRIGLDGQRCTY